MRHAAGKRYLGCPITARRRTFEDMKGLVAQITYFLHKRTSRRNLGTLLRLALFFLAIVTVFSAAFHGLMLLEGQEHSWFTGFYWTLTVMSTLGFGDVTFEGDLGRAFALIVLLTGIVYMLVLFPFTFIQFFYAPWMEAQSENRAPRQLPKHTSGHILITHYDEVTAALIAKLDLYNYEYYLIVPEISEALRLVDNGIVVVVGDLDDPEAYRNMRVEAAALVAATGTDAANTHVAFTVRELDSDVPIVATANDPASVDILELAGCSSVLQLGDMLGQSLARRTQGGKVSAHVIGQYDRLLIAEASATETSMVGKTLREIALGADLGVTVVGVWERGLFQTARPETLVGASTVLVLAASREQLDCFDERFPSEALSGAPVVIIGGGRVGRAVCKALAERGVDYRLVDENVERCPDKAKNIHGNAAELEVLKEAGIMEANTAIITTRDDDTNVYLTLYCRRLRPDLQVITRVTLDRNITTVHRAGSDFVMSYASTGANSIFNVLKRGDTLMVAEGLDVFRVKIPPTLSGRTITESGIRRLTGCTIIALSIDGDAQINPDPRQPLPVEGELILIGSTEGESTFIDTFVTEDD